MLMFHWHCNMSSSTLRCAGISAAQGYGKKRPSLNRELLKGNMVSAGELPWLLSIKTARCSKAQYLVSVQAQAWFGQLLMAGGLLQ